MRCVSLDSLGERLGKDVVPYARRLAAGRGWEEKLWAEAWLSRFGDAEDVPFMADRVRRIASGKRQIECHPPEVSDVVPFLLRHEGDSRARVALDALRRHAVDIWDWLAFEDVPQAYEATKHTLGRTVDILSFWN